MHVLHTLIHTARAAWTRSSLAATGLLLAACAPLAPDKSPLPKNLPTMQEIHRQHAEELRSAPESLEDVRTGRGPRTVREGIGDLAGYTRSAWNETELLFPTLPNPTLVMYVDPHLTEDGHPVPGYTTAFPMFERAEYALPGEAAPLPAPTGPVRGAR